MRDSKQINILVVDDDRHICDIVVEALASEQYQVVAHTDPEEALAFIDSHPVDLVLTDLILGKHSGEQIVDATRAVHSDAVIILMTAHPTVNAAISVLKKGAFDFLVKPFKLDLLQAAVRRGLRHQRLARENLSLRSQVAFLKTATAFQAGMEIESFLKLVVKSCKEEMSADAVGLIEIDQDDPELLCKLADGDDAAGVQRVLDEATLLQFTYTKSARPLVQTETQSRDETPLVETFISQPIFVRRMLHGVINVLVRSRFDRLTPGQLDILTILTNTAASAIANQRLYANLRSSYVQAIRGLANAIEARDRCTRGHTERVTYLAELVARHLGWSESQLDGLVMGCSLHDVGKIGIPDAVLNKTSALTVEERELMYRHPLMGLKIIEGIDLFRPAVPYIVAHHERFDGSGYPQGLEGDEIPIEGRLLAVVDSFDAIMATRPYRKGASLREAIGELLTHKGTQFDPRIVDVLMEVLRSEQIDFRSMYGRDEEDVLDLLELTANCEKAPAQTTPAG